MHAQLGLPVLQAGQAPTTAWELSCWARQQLACTQSRPLGPTEQCRHTADLRGTPKAPHVLWSSLIILAWCSCSPAGQENGEW